MIAMEIRAKENGRKTRSVSRKNMGGREGRGGREKVTRGNRDECVIVLKRMYVEVKKKKRKKAQMERMISTIPVENIFNPEISIRYLNTRAYVEWIVKISRRAVISLLKRRKSFHSSHFIATRSIYLVLGYFYSQ